MQKTKIDVKKHIAEMEATFETLKEGLANSTFSKSANTRIIKELEEVAALAERLKEDARKKA